MLVNKIKKSILIVLALFIVFTIGFTTFNSCKNSIKNETVISDSSISNDTIKIDTTVSDTVK